MMILPPPTQNELIVYAAILGMMIGFSISFAFQTYIANKKFQALNNRLDYLQRVAGLMDEQIRRL